MHSKKNILVLAAHPDDETIGAGATIARLAAEGNYIKLLTFTDGISARGPSAENRNVKLIFCRLKLLKFTFH